MKHGEQLNAIMAIELKMEVSLDPYPSVESRIRTALPVNPSFQLPVTVKIMKTGCFFQH